MTSKKWALAILEAILWYGALYALIGTIQGKYELWLGALIVLGLGYAAAFACPLLKESDEWKRLWKKNEPAL